MGTSAQSIPPGRRQVETLPHMTTMVDEATILKVCDIYDWDGKGELDLFFLGDVVYACGLNTTKKVCVSLGQTDEEGKKLFAELCDPEDDDGFFPYTPFVDRLMGK